MARPQTLGTALLLLVAVACGGATSTETPLVDLPPEREPTIGAVEGPDLFLGLGAVELGRIWQGAVREVVFPLTSSGTEPVAIRALKPDCGCTLASARVMAPGGPRELVLGEPLEPGTRVEVTLRYDSRGRGGPEPKSVHIYHDGVSGSLDLQIHVDVAPFLVAEPMPLAFGRRYLAEPVEETTLVRAAGGEAFELDAELVGEAVPGVAVELEQAEGQDGLRATAWRLTARLDPAAMGAPGGPLEAADTAASLGGVPLIQRVLLTSDVPLEAAGPLDAGLPASHFLDLVVTASLLAPVQADTGYLSFGFLAPGSATAASARIECFAPELLEAFRAAPPTARIVDAEGADPDWAEHFVPTLRPVEPETPGTRPLTPGALFAWDLEVLGRGFRGGDKNRVTGRVVVDFDSPELPDPALAFQAILQP